MAQNSTELRRQKYFSLSSQLAHLDNTQLRELFDHSESNESSTGWGSGHIIDFGKSKVFVKRIPVTNLEYDNLFSTKNLYSLPTFCNYGIGPVASTGFGIFRELVTHIKTTQWVLDGEIATIPLMYHYRIMPFFGQRLAVDMDRHKAYVESWGNNVNIGNYALDRAIANYELVLFLEYIPHILATWLHENPNTLEQSLNEIRATIDFLRMKGIIHFDAHFHNILTDGNRIYLTDFGLVLDKNFALTKDEEDFFEQNIFYDYGEVLRNLRHLMRWSYDRCSEIDKRRIVEKYDIKPGLQPHELVSILLDNIELIQADGDMQLDEFYVASIVKYRSIIMLMHKFFAEMWGNQQKDTKLPHVELQRLLKETGFLPNAEVHGS
ncbi:MAG: hypothetical protein HC865_24745 [Cyanobacteria bacterium RU_5_0]|nr:hypothetical protein [Cyanobacteria bacterium RU_5_0]